MCFDDMAHFIVNANHPHHVIDCKTLRRRRHHPAWCTTARQMAAHRRLDRRRVYRCVVGLRKRAYHFLRNAAASFLATHRSTTQISHNAIRNPTTGSSKPMSFQKDLAPPGIYDGICAIAKSTSLTWVIDCSDSTSLHCRVWRQRNC